MSYARGAHLARLRAPAALGVALLTACGPRVSAVETAQVRAREPGAEVLVYVRDRDGIPPCPWELLGTVDVEPGWADDEAARRGASRAAAKLGGHALMAETAADAEARILRFFDPLCNPLSND